MATTAINRERRKVKDRNVWAFEADTARLTITRNSGEQHTYTIDRSDFDEISKYLWRVQPPPKGCPQFAYAYSGTAYMGTMKILHRYLTDAPAENEVSFIDHDSHNCRRSNLRVASHYETMTHGARANKMKSGYNNVVAYGNRWKAQVKRGGKTYLIGTFDTVREAVEARDRWLSANPAPALVRRTKREAKS